MGSKYWQSLNERAGSAEFTKHLEAEFASEFTGEGGFSRRNFLQVMGASIALAGFSGCEWPEEEIVPFGMRPENYRPGRLRQYATMLEECGVVRPVLATSYDGRPIKIEGNPDHPLSGGATDLQAQASVLDLYDPDRLRSVTRRQDGLGIRSSWEEFDRWLPGQLEGARVQIVAEPSRSPSIARMRQRLGRTFSDFHWADVVVGDLPAGRAGREAAFGQTVDLDLDLRAVRTIADFGADLLGMHPTALRNAREFAEGRDPQHEMNRLWVFEPTWTVTGMAADHRFALSGAGVERALFALAHALVHHGHLPHPEHLDGIPAVPGGAYDGPGMDALAQDLAEHAGRGVVVVGEGYSTQMHWIAAQINAALGNRAARMRPRPVALGPLPADRPAPTTADVLVILGGDPVYQTDGAARETIEAAGCSIYIGPRANATSDACTWVLPETHALEEWGDAIGVDGNLVLRQPLIAPLLPGRSQLRLLAQLAGQSMSDHEIVRGTFERLAADRGWREALHAGLAELDRPEPLTVPVRGLSRASHLEVPTGLQLHLFLDRKILDGRFANNAWLQELPDPVTKLTWDNAALFSVRDADELGVRHGDVVRLTTDYGSAEIAAMVLPGQASGTVSVARGYGRSSEGRVGRGVGVDVQCLGGGTVSVERTGRTTVLACTQDHWAIDPRGKQERANRVGMLVREGTATELREHPEFVEHRGIHHPPLRSLWEEREYEDAAWGMAIDLNRCTGCSACVIACVAENNIPVVGREQVANGREMQWLRIDRYFQGEPENPSVANQPMACVHCEMAPCEQVCPVGATMHSAEGLNVMAYNRCVGTRYCSNNCPYKVRRFNFFEYNGDLTELEQLVKNPEVSIRSRGVMEKCTYCVQRIEHARIHAKNEDRPIADGEIQPACQQTCPTRAITFGDLNQEGSEVAALHADHRSYAALAELNVKPRTRYLARIRNPHPALAGEEPHGEVSHG